MYILGSLLVLLISGVCFANGLQIPSCGSNGSATAVETHPFVVNCTAEEYQNSTITWNLNGFVIAECPPKVLTCRVYARDVYTVTRERDGVSTLIVKKRLRTAIAGRVTCKATHDYHNGSQTDSVSCDVRVTSMRDEVSAILAETIGVVVAVVVVALLVVSVLVWVKLCEPCNRVQSRRGRQEEEPNVAFCQEENLQSKARSSTGQVNAVFEVDRTAGEPGGRRADTGPPQSTDLMEMIESSITAVEQSQ